MHSPRHSGGWNSDEIGRIQGDMAVDRNSEVTVSAGSVPPGGSEGEIFPASLPGSAAASNAGRPTLGI